jgi:hypothetical protein
MGRIIGRAWDMMGALVEGPVSGEDIRITGEEIPKLYAGRATPGSLVWCRANRSGRAFNHTVDSLAAGRQPDIAVIADSCYLMRNTGLASARWRTRIPCAGRWMRRCFAPT